jgi:hypothetical protein
MDTDALGDAICQTPRNPTSEPNSDRWHYLPGLFGSGLAFVVVPRAA